MADIRLAVKPPDVARKRRHASANGCDDFAPVLM